MGQRSGWGWGTSAESRDGTALGGSRQGIERRVPVGGDGNIREIQTSIRKINASDDGHAEVKHADDVSSSYPRESGDDLLGGCGDESHRTKDDLHRKDDDDLLHRKEDDDPHRRNDDDDDPLLHRKDDDDPLHRKEDDDPLHRKEDDDPLHRKKDDDPLHRKENDDPHRRKDDDDPHRRKEDDDPHRRKDDDDDPLLHRKEDDEPLHHRKEDDDQDQQLGRGCSAGEHRGGSRRGGSWENTEYYDCPLSSELTGGWAAHHSGEWQQLEEMLCLQWRPRQQASVHHCRRWYLQRFKNS